MKTVTRHTKLVLALLACGALFSPTSRASPTQFRVYMAGLKSPASLSILPANIAFGNVSVGQSGSTTVTVSNSGGTDATNLQYLPSSNFSVSGGCGSTLSANSQCTETVTFTPTAGQSYSGNLTVTNGGTLSTAAGLSGMGLLTADRTSTTALNFGNQPVGVTSTAQSVQLINSGNTTLTVGQISTTGPYAATQNCGTSLAADSSCTVNVTFTPTAINSGPGVLSLTTNAGTQSVTLAGNGQQAILAASPSSLAFGNVTTGQSSTAKSFTLTNNGNIAATSLAISPPAGYTQNNNCGTSLAAGTSCSVNVTFSPTASTTYNGNLQITSSATTVNESLSGTGVCASGSQIFTSTTTFSPVAGCATYKVLVVGGGGGGGAGQASAGGSGYVTVQTIAVPSAVTVTVGGGGAGAPGGENPNTGNFGYGGGNGGTSCFGSVCSNGGYTTSFTWSAGSGGSGGGGIGSNSTGGTGGTGGSAGTAPAGGSAGSGQGSFTSSLTVFTQRTVSAAAGGAGGTVGSNTAANQGGGGGGGIYINGSGSAGSMGGAYPYSGYGGGGWGGGGGGGGMIENYYSTSGGGCTGPGWCPAFYGGGAGAPGVVYVEWSQ